MKLLQQDKNHDWQPVEAKDYDNESALQDMLVKDPNILPLEEIGYEPNFVTIGREVSLKNGYLDVMAVSPAGHIALIETKLDKNPEVKRTVVGQVLGYAAYLWNSTYGDLEETHFKNFQQRNGLDKNQSLADYVRDKAGEEDFSEEEFRNSIGKRLQLGSFTLIIAVDRANTELQDIVNYLNERTGQEIDIYLVEVKLLEGQNTKLLIPRLVNPARKSTTNKTVTRGEGDKYDRTPITKEELLSEMESTNKPVVEKILNEYENHQILKIRWYKTGFSLIAPVPSHLTDGSKINFSFLFVQCGKRVNGKDAIRFDYPKWYWEKFPKLQPEVDSYWQATKLLGYNDKYILEDMSAFDIKVDEMFAEIDKTAKRLSSAI